MKLLISGLDTIECAYFLRPTPNCFLDFGYLAQEKERMKQVKRRDPLKIQLGGSEFMLHSNGTRSGYPFLMHNEDMSIAFGEFNDPSFYVTFRSVAIWHKGAAALHQQFMDWAMQLGFMPYRPEGLSRIDLSFDYHLPEIDFDIDNFVTQAALDRKYRRNKKAETFNFGTGDVVLRVYDKISEIKHESDKQWFFPLWGGINENVWRIEWQVRKDRLRQYAIRTFDDLYEGHGDLLRFLSHEHTTLRYPNEDTNRSRWPLHPLWKELQERIKTFDSQGVIRSYDTKEELRARAMRLAVSVHGYVKAMAALECVMHDRETVSHKEALSHLNARLLNVYDPLTWQSDIKKRADAIRLGK